LRGVAAAIVLVHHSFLTIPSLAAPYYDVHIARHGAWWTWLLTSTPLHLVWAGGEAVFLFFILSGFVLTVAGERMMGPKAWAIYFPRRIVRLFGPVWVAIAVGGIIVWLTHRSPEDHLGPWMDDHPADYTLRALAHDSTLFFGTSGTISPLWSLQWEVWFSLLLPVFLLLAIPARRGWYAAAAVAGLLILSTFGEHELSVLGTVAKFAYFLPMFGIGAVIAIRREQIRSWYARAERAIIVRISLAVVALLFYVSKWLLAGITPNQFYANNSIALQLIGAALLVVIVMCDPWAQRAFAKKAVGWLGTISFSLYLVHEPIVIAARYLVLGHPAVWGFAIGIPASLLFGWLFYWQVERRFHQLSRRIVVGGLKPRVLDGMTDRMVNASE